MKKKFTKLMAALALLVSLAIPMGVWGQTSDYTISFQAHSTSEQSQSLTDDNAINYLSNGASYVTSITGVSKVYQAAPDNGWKLGTGSAVGTFVINLSSDGQVNATKITVKTKKYGSDTGKVKVTLNGNNNLTHEITPGTNMADDDWTLTSTTSITSVKIETTSKRAYVHSVKVTYTADGTDTYTVTYNKNAGNEVTGSVPTDNTEYDNDNNIVTVAGNTGNLEKPGHSFGGWCLNAEGTGTVYGPEAGQTATYTISANTTFYAKWIPNTHDITMPATDTYGSYSASATSSVPYGATVTLTYTPATGYESYVATWSVNGEAISGNTFSMPDDDVTVSVSLMQVKIDVINKQFIEGSSAYSAWENKVGASGAIYAGKTLSSATQDYFQFTNSTSGNSAYAGIITTGSGGKVKKVVVDWGTTTSRTLNIYGSNTAYAATSQLYNSNTYGTLLGTIVQGTSTTLNIAGDYTYVGIISSSGAVYLPSISIYWEPSTDPSITASDVNIEYGAEGGNIEYTINNPVDGATLEATVASGATISNFALGSVGASPITFTCDANTENTDKTATVTLNYVKNAETLATKTVTITQAAAPVIYTTIPDLFDAATGTETNVLVTFNNYVVSGVSTNGKNVFVTDNSGNGFVIYSDSNQSSTYAVGSILSGTAVSCTLKLYNGFAELLNVDASDLTITTGGTVATANVAMANLAGVNTGALLHYENLTCSVNNNKYYLTDGTTSIQVYNAIYDFGTTLENGKTYNITGIYQQYNNTKEILPRSADDIVLKANMSDTDFTSLTSFTYVLGNGPSAAQTVDVYCYDLGTNTLTATAPAGYELSLSATGTYTSSVVMTPDEGDVLETLYIRLAAGLEDGDYNGMLTFTAANLTTVEVDLTGTVSATQNYTITLSQPTVATIAADVLLAEAGTTITLSYSNLDDCYTFTGWAVLDGNANPVMVANNQFAMPESNVEVEGIFTQKTFTVQYSVNGAVESSLTESVNCGDYATLPTSGFTVPTGYTFAGWSTSAGSTEIAISFTPEDNAILYAVFLSSMSAGGYQLITSASQITEGIYLFAALRATELPDPVEYSIATGTISSGDIMVTEDKFQPTNNAFATIPTGGVEFELTGNNTDGFIVSYNDNSLGYTAAQSRKLAFGDYDSYLWKFYDIEGGGLSGGAIYMQIYRNYVYYTVSENATATSAIRGYASNTKYRGFYLFKKTEGAAYTLVEDITTDASLPGIEPTYLITVKDGATLTLTGSSTGYESNLIIEDGGQLITSSPVKATFKKTTTASTETKEATNNWYAISSPVNEIAISTFAAGKHNVYRYIEKSHYWNEYRSEDDAYPSFSTLENGRGYLYRSTEANIEFAGDVNIANATYTLSYTDAAGNLAGFHLIGNPYTHNIYKGANAAINSEYLTEGLYTLNVNGGWVAGTDNTTAIAPGCAVLVQAKEEARAGQTLTITNTDHQGPEARYANDQIMFTVKNSEYSDNSYVLFKKGQGLNKIEHRNAEIPMLYVISEGENYAIADMPDNTDVINLGFEAKTMGQYTISLKAEGQYSYMHLVDKLTGNDIDMLVEDSYTFVGTPNDRNDRFVLRLNYNAAGIDTESDIFAYQSGNEIIISGEGELQVFDITGRKVMTTDINGVETINGMNRGVYIFRLNEKTQKIVVR